MIKIIAVVATIGLAGVSVFAFKQAKELETKNNQLAAQAQILNKFQDENRRFKVINAINARATNGLHATKPEVITEVNQVVNFILASTTPVESKFSECWDRKLKTTSWGSDGPFGLLDACIDTISDSKTAILVKTIDRTRDAARYDCSAQSSSRFDAARDCWADRNYRLIFSADQTLFDFITTAGWMDSQKGVIEK